MKKHQIFGKKDQKFVKIVQRYPKIPKDTLISKKKIEKYSNFRRKTMKIIEK